MDDAPIGLAPATTDCTRLASLAQHEIHVIFVNRSPSLRPDDGERRDQMQNNGLTATSTKRLASIAVAIRTRHMSRLKPPVGPAPLYRGIALQLRKMVRTMQPGTCLPTETELSRQFQVSTRTIREAMQQLIQEGLVNRRQGSGTHVLDARGKIPIAILMQADSLAADIPYYWSRLLQEVRLALSLRGMSSTVYTGGTPWFRNSGPVTELRCPGFFEDADSGKVSGVISLATMPTTPWWPRFSELGIPIVGDDPRLPVSVSLDQGSLSKLAMTAFKIKGCRQLAIVHLGGEAPEDSEVARPFINACTDAGLAIRPQHRIVVPDANDWRAISRVMRSWQAAGDAPDGIFIDSDHVYPAAIMALATLGDAGLPYLVTHHNALGPWRDLMPTQCIGFDPGIIAATMVDLVLATRPLAQSGRIVRSIPAQLFP